jgi:hypothetical protein
MLGEQLSSTQHTYLLNLVRNITAFILCHRQKTLTNLKPLLAPPHHPPSRDEAVNCHPQDQVFSTILQQQHFQEFVIEGSAVTQDVERYVCSRASSKDGFGLQLSPYMGGLLKVVFGA